VKFDEEVEKLKEAGVVAGTFLFIDDDMIKVASVWQIVPKTVVQLEDDEEIEDIWDLVSFDPSELMRLAGLPLRRYTDLFHRMRLFNYIYPDGTIAKEVRAIINQKLSARFGLKT